MTTNKIDATHQIGTTETDATKVLAPDGSGGVQWSAGGAVAAAFEAFQPGAFELDTFQIVTTAAVSPLTTKGDVWGFSTVDARVPIGTNAQVLTADSTQALGLKWATPSGGGGMTHSYVGYNTIGASNETVAGSSTSYYKAFTPGSSGLLTSIGAYFEQTAVDAYFGFQVAVNLDVAGSPGALIAVGGLPLTNTNTANFFVMEKNATPISDANWLHLPCVAYLTGGTQYWLQLLTYAGGATVKIYYDAAGSDQTNANGGAAAVADGRRYTLTNSTKTYSIRADYIV